MPKMTPWKKRCRRQRGAQDRSKRKRGASSESTSEDVSDSVRESAPGTNVRSRRDAGCRVSRRTDRRNATNIPVWRTSATTQGPGSKCAMLRGRVRNGEG
jgi:hypothetical protein